MAGKGHFEIGTPFGDWTVVEQIDKFYDPPVNRVAHAYFSRVRCVCGTVRELPNGRLRAGQSNGCGCRRGRALGESRRTHGKSYSFAYKLWASIKHRLKNDRAYEGVSMHEPWVHNFEAFEAFLLSLGPKPTPAHSLDRIKTHLGYEPGNLRWADKAQQAQNRNAFNSAPRRRPSGFHGKTNTRMYRLWMSIRYRLRNERAYTHVRMCAEWDGDFEKFEQHVLSLGPRPTPQHTLDRIEPMGDYAPGNVRWASKKTQSENRCCAKTRNVEANSKVAVGERFDRLVVVELCVHRTCGVDVYAARVRCDCGAEKIVEQRCLLKGRTRSCGCFKNDNLAPWAKPGASPHAHPLAKPITVDGVTKTASAWARELGTSVQTVRQRIKAGWTPERAVTEPVRDGVSVTIGAETKSVSEWCLVTGVPYVVADKRIRKGWDAALAVTEPVRAYRKRSDSPSPCAETVT